MVSQLQQRVRHGATAEERYTQQEAVGIQYLALFWLRRVFYRSLERIKNQQDRKDHKSRISFPVLRTPLAAVLPYPVGFSMDKSQFTNNGLKKKNLAVIGLLYEVDSLSALRTVVDSQHSWSYVVHG
jgi:hypothetical protein